MGWYAAAEGRDEDAFPCIGAEEGGGDVGVLEGEKGRGEGLKVGSGGCWEVD